MGEAQGRKEHIREGESKPMSMGAASIEPNVTTIQEPWLRQLGHQLLLMNMYLNQPRWFVLGIVFDILNENPLTKSFDYQTCSF